MRLVKLKKQVSQGKQPVLHWEKCYDDDLYERWEKITVLDREAIPFDNEITQILGRENEWLLQEDNIMRGQDMEWHSFRSEERRVGKECPV